MNSNKLYLIWLGILSYLVSLATSSSLGGVSIAFCKSPTSSRASKQDFLWKNRISEIILSIPFRVDPIDCGVPIEKGGMGVSIRFYDQGKVETVIRQKDHSENQFINEIISKIIPGRLSPVKSSLKKTLSGVQEAIVVYVTENTPGESTFQQLLVMIDIPKDIKVFKITNKAFFPLDMQKTIKQDFHLWIILDGQQISHIPLPYSRPTKIVWFIDSIIGRLKFPCKVKYESDEVYSQYNGVSFNFFTVYHHTDQEDEVYRDIIDPLAEIFRPFFVFVSVDIDKYMLPSTVDADSPMPFIVVTKAEQRSGLPIKRNNASYTIEGLKAILNAIIDPEIDKDTNDDNLLGDNASIDVTIPSSLPSLTTSTVEEFIAVHKTCILGFYLPYTLMSRLFLQHLITTSEKLESAGMPIALVNCANYPDICETFNINQFPTAKYRLNGGEWTEYKGILSDSKLVKLAQEQTTDDNENGKTNALVEMNPSTLMKLFKNNGKLKTLGFLVADNVIPVFNDALSSHNVYWLNSTQYPKLSAFLNGLSLPPNMAPPPVLVWVDYTKNLLYRRTLELSPSPMEKEEINEFLVKSANGDIPPDIAIIPSGWKPIAPPIPFPSTPFLAALSMPGQENLGLIDKQPLYADPNRYLLNGLHKPPPPELVNPPPPPPEHNGASQSPAHGHHDPHPPNNDGHTNGEEHNLQHEEL